MGAVDCALFDGLEQGQIEVLCAIMTEQSFAADEVVFTEGDEGSGCFVLTAGTVRVTKEMPCGHAFIVAELVAGDVFGELSLLAPQHRSASCRFLTSGTVLALDSDSFRSLRQTAVATYTAVVENIGRLVCCRLSAATAEVASLLKEIDDLGDSTASLEAQAQSEKRSLEARTRKNADELASVLGTLGWGNPDDGADSGTTKEQPHG